MFNVFLCLQDDLLINLVIEQMVNDSDPSKAELGGAVQLMGIIRLLIDPENMLPTANVSIYTLVTNLPESRFSLTKFIVKISTFLLQNLITILCLELRNA